MIGYYTIFDQETSEMKLNQEELFMYSNTTCQYLELLGDGICQDEANTVECIYDLQDCCNYKNDFSASQNCTCITEQEDHNVDFGKHCTDYLDRVLWGDGVCNLDLNNAKSSFDAGDCCLPGMAFIYLSKNTLSRICSQNYVTLMGSSRVINPLITSEDPINHIVIYSRNFQQVIVLFPIIRVFRVFPIKKKIVKSFETFKIDIC